MKLQAREQVKTLLAQKGIKLKDLAQELSIKTGKSYSLSGISHRLSYGSVTYNEILLICEILGYKIEFINID